MCIARTCALRVVHGCLSLDAWRVRVSVCVLVPYFYGLIVIWCCEYTNTWFTDQVCLYVFVRVCVCHLGLVCFESNQNLIRSLRLCPRRMCVRSR